MQRILTTVGMGLAQIAVTDSLLSMCARHGRFTTIPSSALARSALGISAALFFIDQALSFKVDHFMKSFLGSITIVGATVGVMAHTKKFILLPPRDVAFLLLLSSLSHLTYTVIRAVITSQEKTIEEQDRREALNAKLDKPVVDRSCELETAMLTVKLLTKENQDLQEKVEQNNLTIEKLEKENQNQIKKIFENCNGTLETIKKDYNDDLAKMQQAHAKELNNYQKKIGSRGQMGKRKGDKLIQLEETKETVKLIQSQETKESVKLTQSEETKKTKVQDIQSEEIKDEKTL